MVPALCFCWHTPRPLLLLAKYHYKTRRGKFPPTRNFVPLFLLAPANGAKFQYKTTEGEQRREGEEETNTGKENNVFDGIQNKRSALALPSKSLTRNSPIDTRPSHWPKQEGNKRKNIPGKHPQKNSPNFFRIMGFCKFRRRDRVEVELFKMSRLPEISFPHCGGRNFCRFFFFRVCW